ncbi:MAG TPA: hypothetical protein VJ023_10225 [Pyrinomonadaceae bacterium]|nr:hypothetical protein [Pyrinomonadaceae bacterium]
MKAQGWQSSAGWRKIVFCQVVFGLGHDGVTGERLSTNGCFVQDAAEREDI